MDMKKVSSDWFVFDDYRNLSSKQKEKNWQADQDATFRWAISHLFIYFWF